MDKRNVYRTIHKRPIAQAVRNDAYCKAIVVLTHTSMSPIGYITEDGKVGQTQTQMHVADPQSLVDRCITGDTLNKAFRSFRRPFVLDSRNIAEQRHCIRIAKSRDKDRMRTKAIGKIFGKTV